MTAHPTTGDQAGQTITVDLDRHRNNVGITPAGTLGGGGLNVWGNSLPAGELPVRRGVEVDGVPFAFPDADGLRPDNVRCAGQLIEVVPGRYDWLHLLAAGERRVEDEVALHFAGGELDFEAVRVSDFWAAPAVFGEIPFAVTGHMHYPGHVQPAVPGMVWCQRVPITRRAQLRAFRLPRTPALHVFAATLVAAAGVGAGVAS